MRPTYSRVRKIARIDGENLCVGSDICVPIIDLMREVFPQLYDELLDWFDGDEDAAIEEIELSADIRNGYIDIAHIRFDAIAGLEEYDPMSFGELIEEYGED